MKSISKCANFKIDCHEMIVHFFTLAKCSNFKIDCHGMIVHFFYSGSFLFMVIS